MDDYRKQRLISFFLILVGMIAIMFLAIGCFTEKWLSVEMDIHTVRFLNASINENRTEHNLISNKKDSVFIGLWTVTACVTDESDFAYIVHPVTECQTDTITQLNKDIAMSHTSDTSKENQKEFLKSFLPQKILTVIGGLLALGSIALTYAFTFTRTKPHASTGSYIVSAVSCIVGWIISGALVFAAVGIQDHNNANFEREVKIRNTIPEIGSMSTTTRTITVGSSTSIILLGIGGSFGILLALIIALMAIRRSRSDKPAEAYTNRAI